MRFQITNRARQRRLINIETRSGTAKVKFFRDGDNDTLMFAPAGTSIAMGNATDDVKALATHVTATNDDDGFARAMHDVVLATT